jgi:hypothetical protein
LAGGNFLVQNEAAMVAKHGAIGLFQHREKMGTTAYFSALS